MEHKERTRTSISPLGLNKSTPDNVVEDGALEVCHNLRFANGAWRNVQEFLQKNAPSTLQGKDILYAHIANGKPNYITKDTKSVTTEKVKYYGMRSQPMAVVPKGVDEGSSPNPAADFVVKNPMVGILKPISQTYYLDAPLSVAKSNPNSVKLFDKDLIELGKVAEFNNGRLSYYNEERIDYRDGDLELFYSEVMYAKLGEYLNETFYFIDQDLSAEDSCKAVFVKRGENYIYFGSVTNIDKETNSYAIYERSSGITIACVITSLKSTVIRFKRTLNLDGDQLFHNAYEEYALLMRGYNGYIGYFHGNIDEGSTFEGDATPKFIETNGKKTYLRWNPIDNKEEPFVGVYESPEEYLEGYKELPIDQQIWGFEFRPCVSYVKPVGGACLTSVYSWQFEDVAPMAYIPFFYGEKALDITEAETSTHSTISAWDSNGESLGQIGEFSDNIALDHFGNMIIVRDLISRATHYFVLSEGKYQPYGSIGATTVSFNVSVDSSIKSPKLTDVPMYYKGPGTSASDGSLDGRMFVGAAEPICPLNNLNSNNNLLISNSDNYFRGELALFVVARAKDGTEIYRTPPQLHRSETLFNVDGDVFVFVPEMEVDRALLEDNTTDNDIAVSYPADSYFPYYYLVWGRKYLDHAFFLWDAPNERDNPYKRYNTWKDKYSRYEKHIQPLLDSVKANRLYKLKVDIQAEGQNIHDIVIYSTRLYPLFTIEGESFKTNTIDVLNEPFYKMKVLNGNERSYTITYADLENIETKTDAVFEPTQSGETSFFATKGMEYNNCYHSFDVEVSQPLLDLDAMQGSADDTISDMVTSCVYDGSAYYAHYKAQDIFAKDARGLKGFAQAQSHMIAFPNSIRKVLFGKVENNVISAVGNFSPEYSYTLNSSYILNKEKDICDTKTTGFVRPNDYWTSQSYSEFVSAMQKASRSTRKYKPITLLNADTVEGFAIQPTYPIKVSNRIQVSETNNPLVNPFERSYRIGSLSNEIIAINSAAIEMSDAKFGEFPLYVFTTEGIYAMQSGTESLYSAVIPIAKDVAINPNTLAVNGAVLFFTDKGLHMLSQNGVQLISAGLHEDNNRIPEWMYTCRMVHLPEYNEVMCLLMDGDETTGKAYVFSLDNNYWSERDVPQGEVLNNFEVIDMESIHNLVNEGESVVKEITLETRPIKLGANKELKRLETLAVRFEADKDESLEVTIKGSIDGVEYKDLRKVSASTNTDVLIRRTPASVKYLKFVVKCSNLQSSIRLIRFDTEHYLRFVRKMR